MQAVKIKIFINCLVLVLTLLFWQTVQAQPWPPPPPSDFNWRGLQANSNGPISPGTEVSYVGQNGDVYIAGRVGSDILVGHWDGSKWELLGDRITGGNNPQAFVFSIAATASGDVYLGGQFALAYSGGGQLPDSTVNIARWNASAAKWEAVGQGTDFTVFSIAIDGDKVYIAGPLTAFNSDGSAVTLNKIGYWNISTGQWMAVGQGIQTANQAISKIDINSTGELYVAGNFDLLYDANGNPAAANGIARWDGISWNQLGMGIVDPLNTAIAAFTIDKNDNIYLNGYQIFTGDPATVQNTNGTTESNAVLYWDGTLWNNSQHAAVIFLYSLAADGTGKTYSAYEDKTSHIKQVSAWDGQTWTVIGEPYGERVVKTLAGNVDYQAQYIYMGGFYNGVNHPPTGYTSPATNNALWKGYPFYWQEMVGAFGVVGTVRVIDGQYTGTIMIGGSFSSVAGIPANNIVYGDGANWQAIGGGVNGTVHAIDMQPANYHAIGGQFSTAINPDNTPVTVNNIVVARLGQFGQLLNWMPLGGGVNGPVYAILNQTEALSQGLVHDIIIGGSFTEAYNPNGDTVQVNSIARWDWATKEWRQVGLGVSGGLHEVRVLSWTQDVPPGAAGINFYVGGNFTNGVNTDGSSVFSPNIIIGYKNPNIPWEAVGQGTDGTVRAIERYEDRYIWRLGESRMWVGGDFTTLTNGDGTTVTSPYIALFYGDVFQQWQALGGGVNAPVHAITALTTTHYSGIFLGGEFTEGSQDNGSTVTMNHAGVYSLEPDLPALDHGWNGRVNFGLNGTCRTLISGLNCYGTGELVFAGGDFGTAGGQSADGLAKWKYKWHPYFSAVVATPGSSGQRRYTIYFTRYFGCTSFNRNNFEALADSIGFREIAVIDSLPLFQPLDMIISEVANPGIIVASMDSIKINSAAAGTMILTGVEDTTLYAPNPNGRSTAMTLLFEDFDPFSTQAGQASVVFMNAVTDAPQIDIAIQGGAVLADSLYYKDSSPQVSFQPGQYTFEITRTDNGQSLGTYTIDLTNYADEIALLLLSGFLDPAANQNGPPMSLDAFATGSTVVVGLDPKQDNQELVDDFQLRQNYPNPFNPSTTIEFTIPKSGFVTLKVYNILGEEAAVLVSKKLAAGKYAYDWNAGDMASGVYFYKIKTSEHVVVKKALLLK